MSYKSKENLKSTILAKKKSKKKEEINRKSTVPKAKKKTLERKVPNFWKNDTLTEIPARQQDDLFKKIFKGLAAFMLVILLFLSFNTWINADDKMQNEYEQKLYEYYSTFGENKEACNMKVTKMHFYGGLFEVVSGVTNRILGFGSLENLNYHRVRHMFIGLFGFLGILFTGLFVRDLAGWRAGCLAMLLLFFSPRYFGHSLINPKDIPFAAGYIMTIYFISRLIRELPKPGKKTLIGLTLAIGLAIGVRSGGILVVAYLALFMALDFVIKNGFAGIIQKPKEVVKYAGYFLGPTLGGFLIAIIFWPYVHSNPVGNIMKSLAELSKLGVDIRLIFNGKMEYARSLPWEYLPTWVLITVPLFFHIGLVAFFAFSKSIFSKYRKLPLFLALYASFFPFVYIIYKDSTLYDGWRHLIFPYTTFIALIAIAYNLIWEKFEDKKPVKYAMLGLVALTTVEPIVHTVRNIHAPYVYFNPIQGGPNGAFGEFEMEYWGTSVANAVDWMDEQGLLKVKDGEKIRIATNFHYGLDKYLKGKYGDKVLAVYVRYRQRYNVKTDYGIFVNRYIDAKQLRKGSWPTSKAIHNISVNNTPICTITKYENDLAYRGIKANKEKKFEEAYQLLSQEIKLNPDNEIATVGIAEALMNVNNLEESLKYIKKTREIEPDNLSAMNLQGLYHFKKGQLKEAEEAYNYALKQQPKFATGYYYMALIKQQQGQKNEALKQLQKAINYNKKFVQAYALAAKIHSELGNTAKVQQFQQIVQKLQGKK